MGTNYYLFTRSKRLVHTHFASETDWGVTDVEYEITGQRGISGRYDWKGK